MDPFEKMLKVGVAELSAREAMFKRVVDKWGPPPTWRRPPGFKTLVLLVLEQQVSLASARATFQRLEAHYGGIEANRLVNADEPELRALGVSRQKGSYLRGIASAIQSGQINLSKLEQLDEDAFRRELTQLRGIGNWTADTYLLVALGRPDILPVGDLALRKSVAEVKPLPVPPTPEELTLLAEPWRPWRSVATRILWHAYLSSRGQTMPTG